MKFLHGNLKCLGEEVREGLHKYVRTELFDFARWALAEVVARVHFRGRMIV